MQPQHFKEAQLALIVIAPINKSGIVDMTSLLVKPDLPSLPWSAQSEHHLPLLSPLPPPAAAAPLLHPACPPAAQTECLPLSKLQRVTVQTTVGGKISHTVTERRREERESPCEGDGQLSNAEAWELKALFFSLSPQNHMQPCLVRPASHYITDKGGGRGGEGKQSISSSWPWSKAKLCMQIHICVKHFVSCDAGLRNVFPTSQQLSDVHVNQMIHESSLRTSYFTFCPFAKGVNIAFFSIFLWRLFFQIGSLGLLAQQPKHSDNRINSKIKS